MQGAGAEVNAAFQGGGARGVLYVGVHDALLNRNLKPKNVAGSSAGALQALFFALRITPQDYKSIMVKDPSQPAQFGQIEDIQDFIISKKRQECLETHYNIMANHLKREVRQKAGCFKAFLFDSFVMPQITSILDELGTLLSALVFNVRGKLEKRLVPEMLLNGELVYGQRLVHMLERVLDKYLAPYIDDSDKRKNITLAEFKQLLDVNLIFTASDMTSKDIRILTATTTPDLPVKFACRISTSFPFFFPPIYWDKDWGLYLGEDISGHKLIDGGWMLNLPTVLLGAPDYFREKYIGSEPIPPESIIAFSFDLKKEEEEEKKEDAHKFDKKVAALPDKWPPFLDEDYLRAVKRDKNFTAGCCKHAGPIDSIYKLEIPGLQLLKELLDSKKDIQEVFTGELFFKDTKLLDSRGVGVLNFALDGVNPDTEIEQARQATEAFLAKKLD